MKLTPVGRFGKDISKCSGCEDCPPCHTLRSTPSMILPSQYPGVAGWAGTNICVGNKNMAISPSTIRSIPKDMVRVLSLSVIMVVKWQNSSSDVWCRFHRYLLTACQLRAFGQKFYPTNLYGKVMTEPLELTRIAKRALTKREISVEITVWEQ